MSSVKLHVYDLSHGMAKVYAPMLGLDIDGVWHSGVVVHGREIWFGNGIIVGSPGSTHLGPPQRIVDLGTTEVPWEVVEDFLQDLRQEQYRAERYHLLNHNCNHFADELAQFLTGNTIPSYIKDTATKVAATPLGQMLAAQFGEAGGAPV